MRTGDTQSVPTNTPDVYLEIQVGTPEDVSSRVIKYELDEQIYGGIYTFWLDNADSSLASKAYAGYKVDFETGFSGGTRSQWHDLWVDTQKMVSYEGKLALKLTCIDAWGLMSRVTTTVGAQYWNYKELAPGEPDADAAYYDKTIEDIVTSVIQSALDGTFALDKDDDDNYYDTLKPPIRIVNAREGVKQLMSMTDSFLRLENDNDFHVIQASKQSSVYTFTFASNHFWRDSEQSAMTLPNRVIFHGRTAAGADLTSDLASGTDSAAYDILGIYIDEHYYSGKTELDQISSQSLLDSLAAATIAKVKGQRSLGTLEAPMHCSLELLDKITITDTRYSGTKTITGFVHRMIRRYEANKGIYDIAIELGGVATEYTPSGGKIPMSKAQDNETVPPRVNYGVTLDWGQKMEIKVGGTRIGYIQAIDDTIYFIMESSNGIVMDSDGVDVLGRTDSPDSLRIPGWDV